mmetsp:Transcript_33284/g.37803  ORF Transcript_33284/g.37803 Transcript_33284/m.37803 type:complete len:200 (+) Transcript_33284:51-650(+)
MFEKEIVVDAKGHLLGRLASYVAKELLNGQKIVVVRCEGINISGSLFRNKLKFAEFLKKRMNTNPKKGPIHYRAPGRIFWRTVRGMIAHKTSRGTAAMDRLKCFEGIPFPYDHKKRMIVPDALKALRLKAFRKFCVLGDLATGAGWNKQNIVNTLEEKRKEKSRAFYEKKTKNQDLASKAISSTPELKSLQEKIAQFGY